VETGKFLKIPGFSKLEKLRQDKRVIVYLICVLIATILWFLNALGKDYNTTLEFPVKYVNVPKNRFLANDPPEYFSLKVNAHGFSLLRQKLHLSFTPIILNINSLVSNAKPNSQLSYVIRTSGLINKISKQISNEISILEVEPEILTLVLDSLRSKEVPVSANIGLTFKAQYEITSPIVITPSTVKVVGPTTILNKVDSIYTVRKEFKNVEQDINTEIELIEPKKTHLTPRKVKAIITVDEFTEKILTAPITVKNKPDSVNVKFFPDKVKVSFMVGLSRFSGISGDDFLFTVPYSVIQKGDAQVTVTLEKHPMFIKNLKFTPETFEYLIEKK